MLDRDLADIYGVETRALVQAVKRNIDRFPDDFMFQLNNDEASALRSQFVILEKGRGPLSQIRSLRVHRAWRCNALLSFEEHTRGSNEHPDHAGVREASRNARDSPRSGPRDRGDRSGE